VAVRQILGMLTFLLPAAVGVAADDAYHRAGSEPLEYHGPGREEPAPENLREIRIGYFGPVDPAHPEGGDVWTAVDLAFQEANREGGYRGIPFRLVPGWSGDPWGNGAAQVAKMVYADQVWAVIGSINGGSTHLAEQVVAKARVPLISPVAGDRTVHGAQVPWMFSCVPGDHEQAAALASAIVRRLGGAPFAIVSTTDHDSRVLAGELTQRLSRAGHGPARRLELKSGLGADASRVLDNALSAPLGAMVVIAGAEDSASLVAALRDRSFPGLIFGGPSMGRRAFLDAAGPAADGVLFPLLYAPAGSDPFGRAFREESGGMPDYAAAHAYDAARLLIRAIREAGPNRAAIRDALRGLGPFEGVTGIVEWDTLGQNARPVPLGTIRAGVPVPVEAGSWSCAAESSTRGRLRSLDRECARMTPDSLRQGC